MLRCTNRRSGSATWRPDRRVHEHHRAEGRQPRSDRSQPPVARTRRISPARAGRRPRPRQAADVQRALKALHRRMPVGHPAPPAAAAATMISSARVRRTIGRRAALAASAQPRLRRDRSRGRARAQSQGRGRRRERRSRPRSGGCPLPRERAVLVGDAKPLRDSRAAVTSNQRVARSGSRIRRHHGSPPGRGRAAAPRRSASGVRPRSTGSLPSRLVEFSHCKIPLHASSFRTRRIP